MIPTATGRAADDGSLGWFIFLYALAGWVRLHADTSRLRAGRCFWGAAAAILAAFLVCRLAGALLG